jgi:hypothetical protein
MRPQAPLAILAGILLLAVSAAVILAVESRDTGAGAARAEEFQQLVGGLGFGPAVDLSRCPNSLDPRLGRHCPEDLGPVPGGGYFCPHHACSIFQYPALDAPE